MSDQTRFCLGNRTLCNSIKQYPLQSGCIRIVHYLLKSGNFVYSARKKPVRNGHFLTGIGRGDRI